MDAQPRRTVSLRAPLFAGALLLTTACSGSNGDNGSGGQTGGSRATGGASPTGGTGGAGGSTPTTAGGNGAMSGSTSVGAGGVATSGGATGVAGSTPGSGGANTAGTASAGGASAASGGTGTSAGGTSSGGSAGSGSGAGGGVPLEPAQGALLGEYYGDGSVADTEARIGRKPALHLTYVAFADDFSRTAQRDATNGQTALISWEPDGIDFNDIVSGKLDATIKTQATAAKSVGKPFFLDFAAEMNGDEGWSGNDAPLYVSAYRHIHDLFVAGGATNVVWAWCPNVTDVDGTNKHTLDYYPGDTYVDWTGVDGYNWGSGQGFNWQTFHDVFADIYPILATKGKPILIGEMASDENGGDKGMWIGALLPTLKNDFPMIRGLAWFDVKKERQWQINSSPASLAAYVKFASDPYMNP